MWYLKRKKANNQGRALWRYFHQSRSSVFGLLKGLNFGSRPINRNKYYCTTHTSFQIILILSFCFIFKFSTGCRLIYRNWRHPCTHGIFQMILILELSDFSFSACQTEIVLYMFDMN